MCLCNVHECRHAENLNVTHVKPHLNNLSVSVLRRTNPVPDGCCMTSVEGLDPELDFHIFNISWKSISVGFEDIKSARLLKMFALCAPGDLRPFFIKMVHITHCYPVHVSPKRLVLPVPGFLWEKLPFMAANSFILSVIAAADIIFLFLCLKCLKVSF